MLRLQVKACACVCWQAIKDNSTGRALWWEPQYTYNSADPRLTVTTSCVPASAAMPGTTDAGAAMYNNTDYPSFGAKEYPCIDGQQVLHAQKPTCICASHQQCCGRGMLDAGLGSATSANGCMLLIEIQ